MSGILSRNIKRGMGKKVLIIAAAVILGVFKTSGTMIQIGAERDSVAPFEFEGCDFVDTLRIVGHAAVPLEIGEYAFWNCTSLTVIESPDSSAVRINEGAFRDCISLKSVALYGKSRLEGKYVFSGCRSLEHLQFPPAMDIIPSHSFSYCRNLREVHLPSELTNIGSNAFSECSSLRLVRLPDSVTELESYVFSECVNLETAFLPANGSLLGELIFSGCRSLKRIYELSTLIPAFDCMSYLFEPDETELYHDCVLIVPPGMRTSYSDAPGWSMFENIEEIECVSE